MIVQSLKVAGFGVLLLAMGAMAQPALAGCDADVADADLLVAQPMSEQQILTLIAETRANIKSPTEQAQR